MNNGRKKLKFEFFFDRFFSNFHRLLLTNLLFAIPSAVVFVGFYFLNQAIFHSINIVFSMLTIILLYPFYSGVVMVVRNIVRGDEDVPVVSTFFNAIRLNFLPFLLHGVLICGAAVLSYYAMTFYINMLSVSWVMYALLFFCLLVVLLALYTSFYLPLMTLTYDLKLRYQYKNSFLMSFGEFKNNFFATLAFAVLGGILLTATAFLPNVTVLVIVISVLWALIVPSVATYCYVFFIYRGMVDMIADKENRTREIDEKISAKVNGMDKPKPKLEDEDFSDIDISRLKDTDDFIYHNGRMVKQSTLLKILREREASGEVGKDE